MSRFYWLLDEELVDSFHKFWQDDQEVCGFLIGKRSKVGVFAEKLIMVPNRHNTPQHFFQAETDDLPDDVDRDLIVGAFHTHVGEDNALPSEGDLEGIPEGYLGVVFRIWPDGSETVTLYTKDRWLSSNQIWERNDGTRLRKTDGVSDHRSTGRRHKPKRATGRNDQADSAVHARNRHG